MLSSRFIGAGLVSLMALVSVQPACVAVLGLDDYGPIAEGICKCDAELGFLEDCQETLTKRLEGASPEARQAWLERFEKKKCVECQHALECYYTSPTCLKDGQSCTAHKECCGFDGDGSYCSLDGKCVRPGATCTASFELCDETTSCCGSEGGYGGCQLVAGIYSLCITNCEPSDDFLCPGCCGTIDAPELLGRQSLCIFGCTKETYQLCDPDAEPGTQCIGRECCRTQFSFEPDPPAFLYLCGSCPDQTPDQ